MGADMYWNPPDGGEIGQLRRDLAATTARLVEAERERDELRRDADNGVAGGLTYAECEQAAANYGVDLKCGYCAAVFYTGYGAPAHDSGCKTVILASLSSVDRQTLQMVRDHVAAACGATELLDRLLKPEPK